MMFGGMGMWLMALLFLTLVFLPMFIALIALLQASSGKRSEEVVDDQANQFAAEVPATKIAAQNGVASYTLDSDK